MKSFYNKKYIKLLLIGLMGGLYAPQINELSQAARAPQINELPKAAIEIIKQAIESDNPEYYFDQFLTIMRNMGNNICEECKEYYWDNNVHKKIDRPINFCTAVRVGHIENNFDYNEPQCIGFESQWNTYNKHNKHNKQMNSIMDVFPTAEENAMCLVGQEGNATCLAEQVENATCLAEQVENATCLAEQEDVRSAIGASEPLTEENITIILINPTL